MTNGDVRARAGTEILKIFGPRWGDMTLEEFKSKLELIDPKEAIDNGKDRLVVTKESKEVREVVAINPPLAWVREQIMKAGNLIGSVHFYKRENNELRKMSYRLHVKSPSVAKKPKGVEQEVETESYQATTVVTGFNKVEMRWGKQIKRVNSSKEIKEIDRLNNQIRVLDTNKIVRDEEGEVIGRGAWRMIPLEGVIRISNKGVVYIIKRD